MKDTPPTPIYQSDGAAIADVLGDYIDQWSGLPITDDDDRAEIIPHFAGAIIELRRLNNRWTEIGGLSPGDDPPDDRREEWTEATHATIVNLKQFENRWLKAKYPLEDERGMMPPILAAAGNEIRRLQERVMTREAELHDDPSLM